ncbi:MAG: hypothetical protein ACTSSE_02730 [Candidatus Thorarchaeota archaeon]
MSSFKRLPRLLMIFGVTLVILSFSSPIFQPSYTPLFGVSYGNYYGIMVHCHSDIDIRIESQNDVVFSTFFMDSTNGLLAIREGTLENVTLLDFFLNRTVLHAHLSVPDQGWYSILITPADENEIEFMEIEYVQQSTNPRVLFAGSMLIVLTIPWILGVTKTRITEKTRKQQNL